MTKDTKKELRRKADSLSYIATDLENLEEAEQGNDDKAAEKISAAIDSIYDAMDYIEAALKNGG